MQQDRILAAVLTLALWVPATQSADTLYDERFKRWTQQAEAGDATAQYNLGNAYVRGLEVARDYTQAAQWFAKAAAQNDAKAQYKLGYLYFEGRGVERDYSRAHSLLRKAAQQEYSPAQYYLGRLYAEGLGVEQDYRKAVYWFTQSAEDNYSPAKEELTRVRALLASQEEKEEAVGEARATAKAEPKPESPPPARKAEPVKTAVAAPPPAPKPKLEPKPRLEPREAFLTGNWLNEGGAPSKHMPSELTQCKTEEDWVVCRTDRLRRTNLFAQVDYMVEAKFGRFKDNGNFMGTYRENVLSVLPEDPDDPNPSEEDVPSTGWKVRTVIKCRFEDPKTLDCVNDNFKQEHFIRE